MAHVSVSSRFVTGEQRPGVVPAHVEHVSQLFAKQHTPSVQNESTQSASLEQLAPSVM